ncbi:serpin family protein [Sorangium sp. So ce136]|uniref:serpin family protein n=1 Tax=Sorangium sp. So ce136 TaxID=3133284 RepID=UPI003F00101F
MADFLKEAQGPSSGESSRLSDAMAKSAAAEASAAFALALHGDLAGEGENVVSAPASITAALAMAWVGSQGETASELKRALRLPQDPDALRAMLMALSYQAEDAPGCELSIANALWVQEHYAVLAEYRELVRQHFGAAVEQVDFAAAPEETRQKINAWVAARTKGYIRDLIAPGGLGAITRLVLVNAVFFKGAWAKPFDPSMTRPQPFRRADRALVDVPLMARRGSYQLLEDRDLQVLALPYEGYTLAMVVLLPRTHDGLRDLERSLDAARLHSIFAQIERVKHREVDVYLPRFRIDASFALDEALKRLGAHRAFDEYDADFSGMTADPEGLYINAVVHKALVDVSEEGTVAVAATAVGAPLKGCGPPAPAPVFRADRPFLFAIRDVWSGRLLFLGRLVDPAA